MEGDIRITDRTDIPCPSYDGEDSRAQPCPSRLPSIRHSSNQGNPIKGAKSWVVQDDRRGKGVPHRESAEMGANRTEEISPVRPQMAALLTVGGPP